MENIATEPQDEQGSTPSQPSGGEVLVSRTEEIKREAEGNHEEEKTPIPSLSPEDRRFDRAKGAVIGAFCGDAAGAVLEFHRWEITEKLCKKAIKMPGGGVFGVGEGQITDDGELTMCLLHGLVKGKGKFEEKEVAKYYAGWMESGPFDCGITIGNALSVGDSDNPDSEKIKGEARALNKNSQSNGSLMRSTPLAVF